MAPTYLSLGGPCGPFLGAAVKVLLEMEGRDVLQDLIPNVGQLELVYLPLKRWIIDPDVCGLLDGPGDALCLPTHYGEIVATDVMTRGWS